MTCLPNNFSIGYFFNSTIIFIIILILRHYFFFDFKSNCKIFTSFINFSVPFVIILLLFTKYLINFKDYFCFCKYFPLMILIFLYKYIFFFKKWKFSLMNHFKNPCWICYKIFGKDKIGSFLQKCLIIMNTSCCLTSISI